MTKRKVSRGAWLGSALCLVVLAFLLVGPSLFQKTKFTFSNQKAAPGTEPEKAVMALDGDFPELKRDAASSQKLVKLSSLVGSGQTLLINFWASWCPPCVEELPSLEYLNRQLEERRAGDPKTPRLVAISVDEKPEDVWALYKTLDFKATFVVLHDKGAKFASSMGTTKFPETYWVSSNGQVLFKWLGGQEWLGNDVLQRLSKAPFLANSLPGTK